MNTGEKPIPDIPYGDECPELHSEMNAFDQLPERVRRELSIMPYDCDALSVFEVIKDGVPEAAVILELTKLAKDSVRNAYLERGFKFERP
ncbi:hypothetical protein ACWGMK_06110 [Agrobacterium deltaense]